MQNPDRAEAGTSGVSKKIKSKAAHSDETLVKKHESEKENLDSSVEQLLDDDKKDPDWRRTPLGKRILREKKRLKGQRSYNGTVPLNVLLVIHGHCCM